MGVAGGHHKTTDTKTFEYFRRQRLFTSGRPHDLSLSPRQKVSFTTDPALRLRSREMHQVAISRHSLPREYPDPLSRSLSSRITAATNSIRGIHPMSLRNGLITCQSKSPGWHKRFCTVASMRKNSPMPTTSHHAPRSSARAPPERARPNLLSRLPRGPSVSKGRISRLPHITYPHTVVCDRTA